jgi:hypothetical protein
VTNAVIGRIAQYLAVCKAFYHVLNTKPVNSRISDSLAAMLVELPHNITESESTAVKAACVHYLRTIDRNRYHMLSNNCLDLFGRAESLDVEDMCAMGAFRRELSQLLNSIRIEYYKHESGTNRKPLRIESLFGIGIKFIERHYTDCSQFGIVTYELESHLTNAALSDTYQYSPYLYAYIRLISLHCAISVLCGIESSLLDS